MIVLEYDFAPLIPPGLERDLLALGDVASWSVPLLMWIACVFVLCCLCKFVTPFGVLNRDRWRYYYDDEPSELDARNTLCCSLVRAPLVRPGRFVSGDDWA